MAVRARGTLLATGTWCAAGLVLVAAGCAANPAGPAAEAAIQLPPPGPATTLVLPLDGYSPTPDDQERADRAQAALEQACLAGFGLRWSGPGEAELLAGKAIVSAQRAERFGLIDPAQARRYGYHPPPWSMRGIGAAQQQADEEPPSEVSKVLFGEVATAAGKAVPQGGCRGEAFRRLSAGTDQRAAAPGNLVSRLEIEAATKAGADHRITAVWKAWAACLRLAGYDYPTPAAAARDKRWETGRQPTTGEVAVATADVDCKTKVGYVATTVSVRAQYQRALIAEHAGELGQVKRLLAEEARNAGEASGR